MAPNEAMLVNVLRYAFAPIRAHLGLIKRLGHLNINITLGEASLVVLEADSIRVSLRDDFLQGCMRYLGS